MPDSPYQSSLKKLNKPSRLRVEKQLDLWMETSPTKAENFAQIAKNIQAETALTISAFTELLSTFSKKLESGSSPKEAWTNACKCCLFKGKQIPVKGRPKCLGRAIKLDDYLTRNFGGDARMKHAFMKKAGKVKSEDPIARKMKKKFIGGDVIWATFSDVSGDNPFAGLTHSHQDIRISLGLGHVVDDTIFLLLTYDSQKPEDLPLYRPSIGDAACHYYFRPSPSKSAHWGLTHPLTPNPRHLAGRPELIHSKITGSSLIFPYHVTTT